MISSDSEDSIPLPPLPDDKPEVVLMVSEQIVATLDQLRARLGPHDLAPLVHDAIERKDLKRALPKGIPDELLRLLRAYIDKAPAPPAPAAATQERRIAAARFLADVLRNEFKTPGKRWAANLTNASLRTGIVVTLCIVLREALAFSLARNEALGEHESTMRAAGISMIAMTLGAHLVGGAADLYRMDKKSKLGSVYSVVMRLGMCLFALAALLGCYLQGTLDKFVTRSSSFLTYCYARDLCNFFLKLGNNVATLPKKGVVGGGVVYGLIQFLTSFLPDQVAPLAGAGGVPKLGQTISPGNLTVTLQDIMEAGLNLPQTVLKAFFNALADIADDVVAPALLKNLETPTLLQRSEQQAFDERKYEELQQSIGQWAAQLFDMKSDEARHKEIEQYSWALYGILQEHLRAKWKKFKKFRNLQDQVVLDRLAPILDEDYKPGLPPASELVYGQRNLPDFATFKTTLVDALDAIADEFKEQFDATIPAKLLTSIARQVYIDSVIDAYMPIRSSSVQDHLRAAVLQQDPLTLPAVLRALVARQVRATRKASDVEIQEGLRLTLALSNPLKDADLLQRGFTQFATTSAARQTFYIFVFGSVYALNSYIEEAAGDDPVIASVLQALLVMGAVIVGYQFFYGVHDRARTDDGQQPLPGGDDTREFPEMPGADELAQSIHEEGARLHMFIGSSDRSISDDGTASG